ncbi:MAG TPA: ABC transporter permease [candidate division Zixibacteria bacterium]|nr:ABC transporter permease [candidate division Zixibacteria bacterium]
MIFRDLIEISLGNLWRMKLRSTLTISGVVIAIAAFVAMLSFGAGMNQLINAEFDTLGLFTTMHVYPGETSKADSTADSTALRPLDSGAIAALQRIPGVRLAYPYETYDVTVTVRDTTIETNAQALPTAAVQTRFFSDLAAGERFTEDTGSQCLVTTDLLEKLGLSDAAADSLLGETLIVSVDVVSLDSAMSRLLYRGDLDSLRAKFSELRFDSLMHPAYQRRALNRELGLALARFMDGYLNARERVSDTLIIAGVMNSGLGRGRVRPLIAPVATGRRLAAAGFSGGQIELMTALAGGKLFASGQSDSAGEFSRVTLDLDPATPVGSIGDSVKALGFTYFSYIEEFEQIQRIFLYFNLALGMVGIIALTTASLGIVNTMVMSITERRREIGVIKSLGADESDIRRLFLVESSLIGLLGAGGGLLFGWLISRIASLVAKAFMLREGAPEMELFALPLWLIFAALALGTIVALAAGYIPSSRAARVDPVAALRND